jgi:hypothetical protein
VFSVKYKTVSYMVQTNITLKVIILEIFAVLHNRRKSDFETANESVLYFEIKLVPG